MKSDSIKKVKLNAFSSYINFALTSLIVLFINPYLVQYLGAQGFGIWKTLQKLLSFASVADGRAGQALKWIIANDENNKSVEKKQEAIGAAIKIWLYFLPINIVILVLFVFFAPSYFDNLELDEIYLVKQVVVILGLNIVLTPLFGIPDAVLVGTNKGYKSMSIQTINTLVSNVFMVLTSYLGYGIMGLAYVTLAVTFLNAIFIYIICRRETPWFGYRKSSKAQVREFLNFSIWVLVWTLVIRIILAADIILIGYYFTPNDVTNYVFSTYIIQLAIAVTAMTGSAAMPGLGKVIGSGDTEKQTIIIKNTRELVGCLGIFISCLVLILNQSFVSLWMNESYYIGHFNDLLIVLTSLQIIHFRNESQIQDLTLKIQNKVLFALLSCVLTFLFCFLIFVVFEKTLTNLLFGLLFSRLALNFYYKRLVDKMMNESRTNIVLMIKYVVVLAISYVIGTFLQHVQGWFALALYSFLFLALYCMIFYFVILPASLRETIKKLINFKS